MTRFIRIDLKWSKATYKFQLTNFVRLMNIFIYNPWLMARKWNTEMLYESDFFKINFVVRIDQFKTYEAVLRIVYGKLFETYLVCYQT